MYTHPAHFDDELITVIRDEKKVCRYIDLPVQHINDRVLRRMNRRTTKRQILGLIGRLRRSIPGLTLRTSIIVGFPGETDGEFRELLSFVRDTGFERLGAFTYSREAGTAAARMSGQVSEAVKRERYDELMRVQQAISLRANRRMVGRRVRVLVDEKVHGQRVFAGRTGGDAPEVDNTVYVSGGGVKAGEFCEVRVTDAMEYDLVGDAV
jgi:ribosomal protein S12 methylthiotransferase